VRSLAAKTVGLGNTTGLLKFGLLNLLLCAFLGSGAVGQKSSGSGTPSLATIIEGMERAQAVWSEELKF